MRFSGAQFSGHCCTANWAPLNAESPPPKRQRPAAAVFWFRQAPDQISRTASAGTWTETLSPIMGLIFR